MLSTFVIALLSHPQPYGDKGKREIASEKHQSQRFPQVRDERGSFLGHRAALWLNCKGEGAPREAVSQARLSLLVLSQGSGGARKGGALVLQGLQVAWKVGILGQL